MRKFFKFFPMALVAVALASCSSDDFEGTGAGEIQLKSNQMLVTTEPINDEGTTRAGFVEKEVNSLINFVTVFNNGDVLKIYHDQTNWRPQEWTYSGTVDAQYTNAGGAAGGSSAIFEAPTGATQYTSGYGIFPATYKDGTTNVKFGQFNDEDRKTMSFDMDMLKVVKYTTGAANLEASSDFADGTYRSCPIPMWGVTSSENKMTLKYLTAMLRIDIAKVPATAAGNEKWLLVRSDKALTGTFTATIADPDNATTGLSAAAPVLVSPAAVTNSTDVLATYPKTGATAGNTDILINLGQASGDIAVYVPIAASYGTTTINHNFQIFLSGDEPIGTSTTPDADIAFPASANVVHNGNAAIAKNNVQRGLVYNVYDDSRRINSEASTPFQMVQAIIAADKAAMRNFSMTFTKPIAVTNDDNAPQRQWIDFSNKVTNYGLVGGDIVLSELPYELKHEVTVNVTFNGSATGQVLKIRNIGGKKLTLNCTAGTNPVDFYVHPDLSAPLTLGGTLRTVTNESNNQLTVAGYATNVITKGKMDVDANGKTVTNLVVLNECKGVNIKNGNVTNLKFAPTADGALTGTTKYTGNPEGVNIYTEGTAKIVNIAFDRLATNGSTTAATLDFAPYCKNVKFTSKYTNTTTASHTPSNITGAFDGTSSNTAISTGIISALQLKGLAADARILAQEIDLNSENWTPLASYQLNGNYDFYPTGSTKADAIAAAGVVETRANIKNLAIKNFATANGNAGLFATLTSNVSNLILSNANITATSAATKANLGVLAGSLSSNLDNVEVQNATIDAASTGTQGTNMSIGAVAGTVTTSAIFTDIKVTTANLKGYASIGGIVGSVAAGTTIIKLQIGNVGTSATATDYRADNKIFGTATVTGLTKKVIAGANNSDPVFAMVGDYVGTVKASASTSNSSVYIYKAAPEYSFAHPENAYFNVVDVATTGITPYEIKLSNEYVGYSGTFSDNTTDVSKIQPGVQTAEVVSFQTWSGAKAHTDRPAATKLYVKGSKPGTETKKYNNYVDL